MQIVLCSKPDVMALPDPLQPIASVAVAILMQISGVELPYLEKVAPKYLKLLGALIHSHVMLISAMTLPMTMTLFLHLSGQSLRGSLDRQLLSCERIWLSCSMALVELFYNA